MMWRQTSLLVGSLQKLRMSASATTNQIPVASTLTLDASSSKRSISDRRLPLTLDQMNENYRRAQYAVRGALVMQADSYLPKLQAQARGEPVVDPLPFSHVTYCNIGNPMQLGQKPIHFFREVLSLLEHPGLMDMPAATSCFSSDSIERAKVYLRANSSGTGAYTHSMGVPLVRQEVGDFIARRDGFPADPSKIFLTDGASSGVKLVLAMLLRSSRDGVMIPIPQYPLYSATLAMFDGAPIPYFLNEEKGWGLALDELERSYSEATSKGVVPRALVIINPGNPTGQVLSHDNMRDIVLFCDKYGILLMADEVYQENVYVKDTKPFVSFKRVAMELEKQLKRLQMVSFHSTSKGVIGECGKRGGYFELFGFDQGMIDEFYKCSSISLCPNTVGQFTTGLMVNPPKPGSPSFARYTAERDGIYESLKLRANQVTTALNKLEGVTCNPAEGAMYAFPRIRLSDQAIKKAQDRKLAPDAYYCARLLEKTGILVVPGSGFGQVEETWHFRTTFLPPPDQIVEFCNKLTAFHAEFIKEHAP